MINLLIEYYIILGQHGDPRCVYVPPSTGQTFFSFRIAYARCGTKPGKFISILPQVNTYKFKS